MTNIRKAMVAGMFYPAEAEELRRLVLSFLEAAWNHDAEETPKAIVAPHAGYLYSGPIAGNAYAHLSAHAGDISRVVLFGPAHHAHFTGMVYSGAESFLTPLGAVPVDRAAYEKVCDLPQVFEYEQPFEGEHSLEVQLPFLQLSLEKFRIVPFLVGDARTREVAQVIEHLWGGEETLFLVSTDLSHFLDYDRAKVEDAETTRAIEALRPESIAQTQACGRVPLRGLLYEARRHGLKARTLDLRNSGDTTGPRDRVVGYGAYAFS